MKKLSKLVIAVAVLFFVSCEKEDALTTNEKVKPQTSRTDSRFMAYGDIVTINYLPTIKFLSGESNGDATFNKVYSATSQWMRFKIVNPNNPTSVAEVKTGDEISFKCVQNNLFLVAESWDDDVNINRTAIGPWEKWRIYDHNTTTTGESIFYSSTGYMAFASLKGTWGKYLRSDAAGFAKANGAFDPTLSVMANANSIQFNKQ